MADVVEVDALTGEVIERKFTKEEKAQRKIDAEEFAIVQKMAEEAELKKQQDLQSAFDKLSALGLTEDEVKAIVGGIR
jgi:phosphoenolpyruvate carboxylase